MLRILLVCFFVMLMNGCASKENLEFNLNTWVGHSVNGLIQYWGNPSDVKNKSEGGSSYTWLFDDGISNAPIEGVVNSETIYCKITVDVSNYDMIQTWEMEGNNCKA